MLCMDKSKLLAMAVSCAFLYVDCTRSLYIELPGSDRTPGKDLVWKLQNALYGTRGAPANWQGEVGQYMKACGFTPSAFSPCMFQHDEREIACLVHGDDFVCTGSRKD